MRPWRHLTRAAAPLEELLDKPAADAKERREGLGLAVFEALWKETPVVAGRAGGIPMQVPPGFERCLDDRVAGCASRSCIYSGIRVSEGRLSAPDGSMYANIFCCRDWCLISCG
jgi:hypothetical protein